MIDARYIQENVIAPRISAIERTRGAHFCWNDFQEAASNLGDRALLLAPCGAGKNLAAWRWIAGRLAERPVARVLFLYPTRGTATEGFRDYVSWAPETEAALLHGTAAYDLEAMFENGDERAGRDYRAERRLFALGQWPKRIFSATVDSFLGFMASQYASVCLLPLLTDSVVVIDEVHSFSSGMFSSLVKFIEKFDVPVLCMTASLPAKRRERLLEVGLQLFPEDKSHFGDLERIAGHPRYRVRAIERGDARNKASRALNEGKRVLWVVNRVDECQDISVEMRERHQETPVFCYHSRFKLCDRRERHEEVIRLFRSSRGEEGSLVVSTQVCEMSLDLDADVLITEIAPVPSLIQRMGRCCRQKEPGDRRGEVFAYETENLLPYDSDDIAKGVAFINEMARRTEVSQSDLAEYLDKLVSTWEPDRYEAFWQSGFWASAHEHEFREGFDYNIDCILDTDIEEYLEARNRKLPSEPGYMLPVPRSEKPKSDGRLRHLRVAASVKYTPELGYWK
jgi:CRISPR-associated endonuclease/helicase Cas3